MQSSSTATDSGIINGHLFTTHAFAHVTDGIKFTLKLFKFKLIIDTVAIFAVSAAVAAIINLVHVQS